MRCCVVVFLGAAMLVGCSDSSSAPVWNTSSTAADSTDASQSLNSQQAATAPAPVVPAAAPPRPQHRYDFREGEFYGYLGAISEEDQKKGVAAPSVVRFRYLGFWDGAHHLQWIGDNGAVLGYDECAVPCVAIKQTDSRGSITRVGYSPSSIVGAAFEDAMNGLLRRSPAPGTVRDGYRFKGGDPGIEANWQPVAPPATAAPSPTKESPTENEYALNASY